MPLNPPAPQSLHINVGEVFKLLGKLETSLSAHGVIDANGGFAKNTALMEAEEIDAVAVDFEAALVADGLPVPPKIDQVIKLSGPLLDMVASAFGG
jgi:hypothetical protein